MSYRLYDLMVSPTSVLIAGNYVSDKYVMWNLAKLPYIRRPAGVEEDGCYELKATRPATLVGRPLSTSATLENQMARLTRDAAGNWRRVQWTEWGHMHSTRGFQQVGVVNRSPVMVPGAWLDHLPNDLRIEAHDSEQCLRIERDIKVPNKAGNTTTHVETVGAVMPFIPRNGEGQFARLIAAGV
ncbi:hypothetical protein ACIQWR_01125 [Streptomyces sp. NPDC098789]|uniref:hypothetical protein n=1 Tax=Streptomyces sp. NPDC098789 TaxID=3366098 RepID=UPI0038235538